MVKFSRGEGSGKHTIVAIKKLDCYFCFSLFWVVNLVQSSRFGATQTFFFGITSFLYHPFCTRTKIPSTKWSTGDNFMLPWRDCSRTRRWSLGVYSKYFTLSCFQVFRDATSPATTRILIGIRYDQGEKWEMHNLQGIICNFGATTSGPSPG